MATINTEKFIELSPELYDIGKSLAEAYKKKLIQVDAVASGKLKNFNWDIVQDEDSLKLVFYLEDYWKEIEFGRGKTKSKVNQGVKEKIAEWIRVKGIPLKPIVLKNGEQKQPTVEEVANAITQKIHNQGYKGRQPLEKALFENQNLTKQFTEISAKMFIKPVITDILNLSKK